MVDPRRVALLFEYVIETDRGFRKWLERRGKEDIRQDKLRKAAEAQLVRTLK